MNRADLRTEFVAALGKSWAVFPETSDDLQKPTLIIYRDRLAKLPEAPQGHRLVTHTLVVALPQHSSEDALDDALDAVLDVLEGTLRIKWESADRSTWADSYPAYKITLTSAIQRPTP